MANIEYTDLGLIRYHEAWDYQEKLFRELMQGKLNKAGGDFARVKKNYLLFCEHFPVFTLGKSGKEDNQWLGRNENYKLVLIESKENRYLHQHWQTAPQRVDPMRLVKCHHLLVQAFLVIFVLVAKFLHLRLKLLHRLHRRVAFVSQWPENNLDQHG